MQEPATSKSALQKLFAGVAYMVMIHSSLCTVYIVMRNWMVDSLLDQINLFLVD